MSTATAISFQSVQRVDERMALVAGGLVDVGRTLESGGDVPTADLVRLLTLLTQSVSSLKMATAALIVAVDKRDEDE